MNCQICNTEILAPKRKYCSQACKQKSHYTKHKQSNANTSYSQYRRYDKRKKSLIELKGGKCERCGYSKNIAALAFHHLCCKTMPLDARTIGNRSWKLLIEEVRNTQLLCHNCHMEVHYPNYNQLL